MRFAAFLVRPARLILDALLALVIVLVIGTALVARVVPALMGGEAFVVGGGSMEPVLPMGSAVIAMPVTPADLRVGDVVSLRPGPQHAVFTHRVTRLVIRDGGLWVATRGDANPDPDPSLVPVANVIGRVDWSIPYAGYLVALLGSVSGLMFVASISGFLIAATWLLETLEEDQRASGTRRAPKREAPESTAPTTAS